MDGLTDRTEIPPLNITGLSYDSREVRAGHLFAALPGQHNDGHRFIPQAVAQGAVAVMGSEDLSEIGVPYLRVQAPRRALAIVSARYFGEPTRDIPVIGVTGTNGKTTCTYLIESILQAAAYSPALIGTIAYRHGPHVTPAVHTTPESADLQRWIRQARDDGANAVVMEVSSHGLELDRVVGCHLDAAVFTNLSQDHLDFHGDMETYFRSKAKLFTEILAASEKPDKQAYYNWEDPYVRRMGEEIPGRRCGWDPELDYAIKDEHYSAHGIKARLVTPAGELNLSSQLIGRFNLQNILLAVAACHGLGIGKEALESGVANLSGIPGRLERVDCDQAFHVFVDYAHTPDALQRVLACLRELANKRVITVFGCGGDRDRQKRPLMGQAVAQASDIVIVTSDNPRTEDPAQIIADILPGVREMQNTPYQEGATRGYCVEADRRRAIHQALSMAEPEDIVLVAGKGHEDYQIIGTEKIHFDDREEVRLGCEELA